MKGLIYMPKHCKQYLGDRYSVLFNMIVNNIKGFKFEYNNSPSIPKDTDIVIVYGPQHSWPNVYSNLAKLDKKIKVIGYVADLWSYGNKVFENNMKNLLDRYDVVLSSCDYAFKKLWGNWIQKRTLFPNFFAPHERYANIPYNDSPIRKLLITGAMGTFYPLRVLVRSSLDTNLHFSPPHPGFHGNYKNSGKDIYVKDDYAKLINNYSCSLGTSSIYNMAVTKYFEIMASGSLLIADETEDSELAGLIANKYFVPITRDNAIDVIQDCLNNPDKYEHIQKQGMEYTRNNHSVINRFEQLKDIIYNLVGEK